MKRGRINRNISIKVVLAIRLHSMMEKQNVKEVYPQGQYKCWDINAQLFQIGHEFNEFGIWPGLQGRIY